jgi:hypothetical protein
MVLENNMWLFSCAWRAFCNQPYSFTFGTFIEFSLKILSKIVDPMVCSQVCAKMGDVMYVNGVRVHQDDI